ncbi:Uncharacterized protein dnm_014730 [Desulfonema magnum]|uniref:Uncharacterized protein n=1 Tax=Desulfonema magnum TaxID=45655 RepID=A0A975BH82_9BACT|nr:Uncharacterized protein dnm_014730 [Desulfonema magnum]
MYKKFGSPAQVVMNEIQCPDNRGTERDSSLPLQDYQKFLIRYLSVRGRNPGFFQEKCVSDKGKTRVSPPFAEKNV